MMGSLAAAAAIINYKPVSVMHSVWSSFFSFRNKKKIVGMLTKATLYIEFIVLFINDGFSCETKCNEMKWHKHYIVWSLYNYNNITISLCLIQVHVTMYMNGIEKCLSLHNLIIWLEKPENHFQVRQTRNQRLRRVSLNWAYSNACNLDSITKFILPECRSNKQVPWF